MKLKKTKNIFTCFILVIVGLTFMATASAHIPSTDPYGDHSLSDPRFQGYNHDSYGSIIPISPSSPIRTIDKFIIIFSALLSVVYIFISVGFYQKDVKKAKLLFSAIVFQIGMLLITGLIGVIVIILWGGIGWLGPIIPSFLDILFFQPQHFLSILISGVLTVPLSFLFASFFLERKIIEYEKRKQTALFYTLVFNPVFFPVGTVIAFSQLIYASRTANQEHKG